ncbi:MAG: ketopantoate reductase family protein [Pseudomonadota bacterium]|nr:ketopantoate reductase family protein [Pseudomonadota bacterium]
MKILVLGAGGIGGYFGGRLAEAGADVTFLVRPKRREQLVRDGLVVESPKGDMRMPVKTVLAGELAPGYDLVLFTCKAYDLDSAMDAVAPAMVGSTVLVPMLNGIAHFERLDARFGAGSVMGGTCQINVMLRPDGSVFHADPLQRLIFGERDKSKSSRAEAFAADLAKSKIDWVLSEDVELELWEKVVFLCALACATCLFRGNVREIMAAPGGREAMQRALAANTEIATREGHPPRAKAIERAGARLMDPEGLWSASMLRDLEGGGSVEADHIVGWMLQRARKHKVDDTLLSLAYTHLKAYESRRDAKRLPGR